MAHRGGSTACGGGTRRALLGLGLLSACLPPAGAQAAAPSVESLRLWHEAAVRMRSRAESWGDQSYGAVVVLDARVVGEGPSRVVLDRDPDAHAERVAIRDAQARLGRQDLAGALLVSTSRPCALCEAAAASAGIARMVHGAALTDAGAPRRLR